MLCLLCRAGVPQSTTEVRFTDLSIAGSVNVGARSLPSMINDFINLAQVSSSFSVVHAVLCRAALS